LKEMAMAKARPADAKRMSGKPLKKHGDKFEDKIPGKALAKTALRKKGR